MEQQIQETFSMPRIGDKAPEFKAVTTQAKRAAAADGQITLKERAKIARQDKQLDRTINRKKHN
jgi:cytidylate kinase